MTNHEYIEIIAPANAGEQGDLLAIEQYVESLGFKPRVSCNIYGDDTFYANTDEQRAKAFEDAILAKDSHIVWCVKSGKGCTELLTYLNKDRPKQEDVPQKILIGYGDVTALQLYMEKYYHWQTLSAPMLEQIVKDNVSYKSVKTTEKIVQHDISEVNYDLQCLNGACGKEIHGKITGGNLTLVQCSLKTSWEINTADRIFAFEDINEPPYKIERKFTQIEQADLLKHVKAVIICDFTFSTKDKFADEAIERDKLVNETIDRFVKKHHDFPIFRLHNVGHNYKNYPLPFNTEATITIDSKLHVKTPYC